MNYALDALIKQIEAKKEEETRLYFDNLAEKAIEQIQSHDERGSYTRNIETIFMLNLKHSITTFQEFQSKLLAEKEEVVNKLKRQHDLEAAEKERQLSKMEQKYERAMVQLMEQYDNHMKQILPQPQLLPMRVNVLLIKSASVDQPPIEAESIDLSGIFQVKPYETIDSLMDMVKSFYEGKQNPMTTFECSKIAMIGPMGDIHAYYNFFSDP